MGKGEPVTGVIHTNTVESAFSLLKCGIMGTWHRISPKHLPAYLDEMEFRFNNRKNPYLFRDTLMRLLDAPVMEYKNSLLLKSASSLLALSDANLVAQHIC